MAPERIIKKKDGAVFQVGKHKVGDAYKVGKVEYTIHGFTEGGNKILRGPDNIRRIEKLPDDRLSVRVIIEITGKLRRVDLDRFTQTLGKTAAFEFEDGGNGT